MTISRGYSEMDWRKVTIGEALRRSARNWPGNDFVVGMRQRINYATFDAQVDSLAKGFLGLGVGRGIMWPVG